MNSIDPSPKLNICWISRTASSRRPDQRHPLAAHPARELGHQRQRQLPQRRPRRPPRCQNTQVRGRGTSSASSRYACAILFSKVSRSTRAGQTGSPCCVLDHRHDPRPGIGPRLAEIVPPDEPVERRRSARSPPAAAARSPPPRRPARPRAPSTSPRTTADCRRSPARPGHVRSRSASRPAVTRPGRPPFAREPRRR